MPKPDPTAYQPPDEALYTQPPPKDKWLRYNVKSGVQVPPIPQVGSGPDGLFTPADVAHYFAHAAQYQQIVTQQGIYQEVPAPTPNAPLPATEGA